MNRLVSIYKSHIWTLTCLAILMLFGMSTNNVYANADQSKAVINSLQDALTSIVENVLPSVVSITSERKANPQTDSKSSSPWDDFFKNFPFPIPVPPDSEPSVPPESMGTGVIVRSDGYILTNDHVVGGADKVIVTLKDGRTFDGKVFRDPKGDIAIVKIDAEGLPEAKLGDSDKVKVGSIVIAIGCPFGYDQTVTSGVISGVGRQADVADYEGVRYYPNLLQTDASINPGNSGGPLININGEVIGINTLIRSSIGGGNIGIGFAIPSNTAKFIMDQLITTGKVMRGYLGIQPDDLTAEQKKVYGVDYGALVKTVEEGSPADKAGIQVEDVIIDVNGKKIENQLQLRDTIAAIKPGTEVPITVVRNKQKKVLKATIKEDPYSVISSAEEQVESSNKLGFTASDVTPELASKYQIDPNATGVIVTKVVSGSNAAKAGLKPGMLIIKANNKAINSVSDLESVAKTLKQGDMLRLVIKMKERTVLISYKLD